MTEKEKEKLFSDPRAFRQTVRLASVQVASLSPEELSFAIAYEVEPFSGIAAAEADVAWREASGDDPAFKVYDVAVMRRGRGGKARTGASAPLAERLTKPAVVAACIILAAIAADWAFMARRTSALERKVSVQRELESQLAHVRNAARTKRAQASELREGRKATAEAQERVAELRAAYLDIMDTIAGTCGGKTVVKEFKSGGAPFRLHMSAVAANPQSAADVMAKLAEAASAKGWTLSDGTISASESGTTAEFGCLLSYDGRRDGK